MIQTFLKLSGILLFTFTLTLSGRTFGQNYKAIKTDAEYFFLDSVSRDIIAIRIDSTKNISNDIYYYNFKQIRPTDYGCCIINGASWLGDEIIEKPDGMFIFSGYPLSPSDSNDTYRILTKAAINQPWYFYGYHTINQYIEANVSDIELMSFLGTSDSVKVISLTRKDASGQVVADPVNSQKILLSKNFGLIRLPKLDDFIYFNNFYDIVGKTNPITGITNLKTMQIFDFEPGDELHTVYYDRYFSIPYPETTISTIMKVLSKTTGSDGNSVTYEFEQCQSSCYKLSDTNTTVTFRFDTISQTYSTLNTPEFETEPLEPAITSSNNWIIKTTMGLSTDPLFPIPDVPYKAINSLEAYSYSFENCYLPLMIDGCLTSIYYFKGLGGPYYKCTEISWGPSWNLLKYYRKGSETWGTPLSCDSLLQVSLREYDKKQSLKIYPNPTRGIITVSIPTGIRFPCKLVITDISGRIAKEFQVSQKTTSLELGILPAGLYTYNLKSVEGDIFRGKIIMQ